MVQLLLDKRADANVKDSYDNSPLCKAIEKNNVEIVKALLDKGADANVKNRYGNSPLYMARSSNKEIRKLFKLK